MQSVISNLLISHIELRSDESPDIQAHSHQRSVEKVVVPLGDVLSAHQARYLEVGSSYSAKLLPDCRDFIFSYKYSPDITAQQVDVKQVTSYNTKQ